MLFLKFVYSRLTLFGVLKDLFEFLIRISRFSGMFSLNIPLNEKFCHIAKSILPGTSSHFSLVMPSHVAYLFSTKPAHAFSSFNKSLIWYCGKSICKLLQ